MNKIDDVRRNNHNNPESVTLLAKKIINISISIIKNTITNVSLELDGHLSAKLINIIQNNIAAKDIPIMQI